MRNTNRSDQLALTAKPEDTVWIYLSTARVFEDSSATTLEIDLVARVRDTKDKTWPFLTLSSYLLVSKTSKIRYWRVVK